MTATKWMTAAMLSLGMVAAVPTVASAHERDYEYRSERRVIVVRDSTENLRYAMLPGRLQDAVDDVRHGLPVDRIQRIRDDGREFYTFVIYGPRCDTFMRLDCDGRVLSRREVVCERVDRNDYRRHDHDGYYHR